jgi:hypothetical protein
MELAVKQLSCFGILSILGDFGADWVNFGKISKIRIFAANVKILGVLWIVLNMSYCCGNCTA